MANEEHVRVVLGGVEAIRRWRETNPDISFDLRGANLRRAKLFEANRETSMNGANFRGANLEWADFRCADLIGADLSRTNLRRADFHKADLLTASLQDADLRHTNLEDATLVAGDVSHAIFGYTRLLNVDLRDVHGLETVHHEAPSTINEETLKKAGKLPRIFLQGCGLDEDRIEQYAE